MEDPDRVSGGLIGRLIGIAGAERVVTDLSRLVEFEHDWTGRFIGRTPFAVLPSTTEELAAVIGELSERHVGFVPQGGNTGLVAGATLLGGEVVIAMRAFEADVTLDERRRECVVGAGATLRAVQDAATHVGLDYPIDFASHDRATIGGSVATNAGGLRTLRHGPTAARVLGLEAVLPDASFFQGLEIEPADEGAVDLVRRLIGSEGILGVITRARLRLEPARRARATALIAVSSTAEAAALAVRAVAELSNLESFEFVEAEGVELLADERGTHPPLAGRALVVMELASDSDVRSDLTSFLKSADEPRGWEIARNEDERAAIWLWRQGQSEAISRAGIPHKLDVKIATDKAAELIHKCHLALQELAPDARLFAFGHLAEGRLHLNIIDLDPEDRRVDATLLGLVASNGGAIVSEHGVGRVKVNEFVASLTPKERAELVATKKAIDPDWISNPGAVLPLQLSEGSKK